MSPTRFDRLKSLPLTIILTVLIWMYAEAKFTATQENVRITLKPVSTQGELLLRPLNPTESPYQSTITLLVTLEGPKNQIDRIYQEALGSVKQDEEFATLTFAPTPEALKAGSADTVASLNGLRYFRERGVTVIAATPSRMELQLRDKAPTAQSNTPAK